MRRHPKAFLGNSGVSGDDLLFHAFRSAFRLILLVNRLSEGDFCFSLCAVEALFLFGPVAFARGTEDGISICLVEVRVAEINIPKVMRILG